jgi:hypothetical protein
MPSPRLVFALAICISVYKDCRLSSEAFVMPATSPRHCRYGSAAEVNLLLSPGFYCFSKSSSANFTACITPTWSPDLVSSGQSQYWDEGDHVIRYSHHWSGQNGIDLIKDSFWSIDASHEPLHFVAGKCNYADFAPRRKKRKRKPNRRR